MDVYNEILMNIANYDEPEQLRNLLQNYRSLRALFHLGDTVAGSIYIDLHTALSSGSLTHLQLQCIVLHLVDGMSLLEVAFELDKAKTTIQGHVEGGIRRLGSCLLSGELYRDGG